MKQAFWDTQILVAWIDQETAMREMVEALVQWQKKQRITTVTSSLSLAELLVRPIARGNAEMARKYGNVVKKMGCIDFGQSEALAFACIRNDHPDIAPPECIQLACAMTHGVDYYFTTDKRLARYRVDGIGEIVHLKGWYDQQA